MDFFSVEWTFFLVEWSSVEWASVEWSLVEWAVTDLELQTDLTRLHIMI